MDRQGELSKVNSNNPSQLAKALRQARRRSGLTVRQVADDAGMTPATVSRLETGHIESPRPDHLARLARTLGLELEDLYALAGYLMPEGLPELRPYLRTKYGLSDRAVEQLDEYFQALKPGWERDKEVRHEPSDSAP